MPFRLLAGRALLFSVLALRSVACSSPPSSAPAFDGGHAAASDAHHDVTTKAADASVDALPDAASPVDAVPAGPPRLLELAVTAASPVDGASPLALVPPFSPDVHDYYVRCAAGENTLNVAMRATPGSTSTLLQPTTSPRLPAQTLSLGVKENQAIVAAASNGKDTTSYWVRCLPFDFPPLGWSPHPDAGAPSPGYYLVGDFLPPSEEGGYAIVLDGNGVPVWYYRAPAGGIGDVDNVVTGAISFIAYEASKSPPFEIHALDPEATTYVSPKNTVLDGHELQALPDGGFVVISNPIESNVDLTGLSLPGSVALGPGSSIQGCNVVELDGATGEVTWQWVGSDHLDAVKDSTFPNEAILGATAPDGGALIDPFHCNAIDVDPANGNLLVSARNMDSIFYIERATGMILWKMGGSTYTKDNATYVAAADPFARQHDARFLPGWSSACGGRGQISMYDDESSLPGPARGVVYDVVVGGADAGCGDGGGVTGTATVAWQYKGAAMSLATGSFRISADGSRVIDWGWSPQVTFTEVDVAGNDLLDFAFTDGNFSYRAIKLPLTALDLDAMRKTAGLP